LRAVGVILAYFTPFLILFWSLAIDDPGKVVGAVAGDWLVLPVPAGVFAGDDAGAIDRLPDLASVDRLLGGRGGGAVGGVRGNHLYHPSSIHAGVVESYGYAVVPLLPWGLVWSYLVIGFAFNQALVLSGLPGVDEHFRNSMLLRDAAIAKSG
jgi:hypothetical protein